MEKTCGYRKYEFNRITTEKIITYEIAATIKDTKTRDKFINGLLKLQLVLENIELDDYNRKYGDTKFKIRKKENRQPTQSQYGRRDRMTPTRRSKIFETAKFAENHTGHRNIHAWHGMHSVIIARERDTLPEYAHLRL